ESVPDLQARKILQPDWAECEQGDHEAVTYASGAGKVVPRKSLCLRHQCHAGFHEPPHEHYAAEFRSRLHLKCEILLDLSEPRAVDPERKHLGVPPQLMDAVIDRDRAHPSVEIDDIGLNIGQCDLGRRARMLLKPIGPLQKAQECSIPPCKVVLAQLGEVA